MNQKEVGLVTGAPKTTMKKKKKKILVIYDLLKLNILLTIFCFFFNVLVKQFEEAMNASEKEKLYKAIGYKESTVVTIYPKTFIDTKFKFSLHKLEISVFDEEFTSIQKVLTVNFKGFVLDLQRRLAANAIKYFIDL